MDVKAIALDMDGTLLDSSNQIHENVLSILRDLREAGIKIILATGRTRVEIEEIIPEDFPYDGAVTSNGMGCYTKEKEVFQHYLREDLVKQVIEHARENQVYYEMHSAEGERQTLAKDKTYMEDELNSTPPPSLNKNEIYSRKQAMAHTITWVEALDVRNVVKIYFFSMYEGKINNWKHHLEALKQTNTFSTSSSTTHNVEIMEENVSKATGLAVLLEHLKISPKELMAIGDGENDLPMFELCSKPIAMKNAPAMVKEKAEAVTKETYDNHGLYLFLKEFYRENVTK